MSVTQIAGVAMIILNERREVLLLLREQRPDITFPGHWTLPGGHIRAHESAEHAAYREMREETGLSVRLSPWIVYRRYDDDQTLVHQSLYYGTARHDTPVRLGEETDYAWVSFDRLNHYRIGFGFMLPVLRFFRERPDLA